MYLGIYVYKVDFRHANLWRVTNSAPNHEETRQKKKKKKENTYV